MYSLYAINFPLYNRYFSLGKFFSEDTFKYAIYFCLFLLLLINLPQLIFYKYRKVCPFYVPHTFNFTFFRKKFLRTDFLLENLRKVPFMSLILLILPFPQEIPTDFLPKGTKNENIQ